MRNVWILGMLLAMMVCCNIQGQITLYEIEGWVVPTGKNSVDTVWKWVAENNPPFDSIDYFSSSLQKKLCFSTNHA